MNNSIPLILASKSEPRRDVLFSAGISRQRLSAKRLPWALP